MRLTPALCVALLLAGTRPTHAQIPAGAAEHAGHAMSPSSAGSLPSQPGQAAYGAISEIVRLLEADSTTDWSKVNIERLRRHLIDMDEVTMHANAAQVSIPGGARMVVTGRGATREAIRRMARAHASSLADSPDLRVQVEDHPEGAVMTVTARRAADPTTEAKIRGLGFLGLLALGEHHGPHHLALAAGKAAPGHEHDEH